MKKILLSLMLFAGVSATAQDITVGIQLTSHEFPQQIIYKYKDCLIAVEKINFNEFLDVLSDRYKSKTLKQQFQDLRQEITDVFDKKNELWSDKDISEKNKSVFDMAFGDYFMEKCAAGFTKVYEFDMDGQVPYLTTEVKTEPGDGHGGGMDTHECKTTTYLTPDGMEVYSYRRIGPVKKKADSDK